MQSKMAIELALARHFELRYGLQRKGKNRFVPPAAPSKPNPHRVVPKQTGHEQSEISPALQSRRRQLRGIGLSPFQLQPGTGPRELEAPVEVEESGSMKITEALPH